VQVNEKLVVAVKPLVTCVPIVPKLPLQPPEAVQDVAFVELQVKVDVAPAATVVGFAVNSAVGAGGVVGSTVTVAIAAGLVPPAPLQVSEKCVVAATGPVLCVPAVASVPLQPPEAAQAVALVELQVSIAALPATRLAGEAVSIAVGTASGGGGGGVAVWVAPPPPHAPSSSAVANSAEVDRYIEILDGDLIVDSDNIVYGFSEKTSQSTLSRNSCGQTRAQSPSCPRPGTVSVRTQDPPAALAKWRATEGGTMRSSAPLKWTCGICATRAAASIGFREPVSGET
jgi:hypothetical protein